MEVSILQKYGQMLCLGDDLGDFLCFLQGLPHLLNHICFSGETKPETFVPHLDEASTCSLARFLRTHKDHCLGNSSPETGIRMTQRSQESKKSAKTPKPQSKKTRNDETVQLMHAPSIVSSFQHRSSFQESLHKLSD